MPPANLPPPKALCFDDNLATTWKSWKQAWKRYEIATGVHKQEGIVRVSTLLSIIGEDGVKAYDTFSWNEGEDPNNIELVLQKFDQFCAPRTQVIYERYRFNNRSQEPGENVTNYLTELRTIARNCSQGRDKTWGRPWPRPWGGPWVGHGLPVVNKVKKNIKKK